MRAHFILLLCLWSVRLDVGHADKVIYQEEIFGEDMCQEICGNRTHTMCSNRVYPDCSYKKFHKYNLASYRSIDLKHALLHGHNGIRNRIAHRMRVSNMAELLWDYRLEEMAERYLRLCRPFHSDECTQYVDDMTFGKFIDYYITGEKGFLFVSQNRFCMRATYFPLNFVERACSSWYHDSHKLQPPTYQVNYQTNRVFGILHGENNYSHLAFPYINRIGCSLASYENHLFCIICNYYPFFRTNDEKIIFEHGPPATTCPVYFPMKGRRFNGICSAGRSGFRKALQHRGLISPKEEDDDDEMPLKLGVP